MTENPTAFEAIAGFLLDDRRKIDGFSPDDYRLVELGCLLVMGDDSPELAVVFRHMLDVEGSAALAEAVLIHALGYLGAVRMRRAHALLLSECMQTKTTLKHSAVAVIDTNREARVRAGSALYDRFDPGRQAKQAQKFEPLSSIYYPRAMELAGLVLASTELPLRQRQLVTVAMLSCLGGQTEQLRFHIGVACRNEVSRDTLAGIFILVQAYAGLPRANTAAALALDVLSASSASD